MVPPLCSRWGARAVAGVSITCLQPHCHPLAPAAASETPPPIHARRGEVGVLPARQGPRIPGPLTVQTLIKTEMHYPM